MPGTKDGRGGWYTFSFSPRPRPRAGDGGEGRGGERRGSVSGRVGGRRAGGYAVERAGGRQAGGWRSPMGMLSGRCSQHATKPLHNGFEDRVSERARGVLLRQAPFNVERNALSKLGSQDGCPTLKGGMLRSSNFKLILKAGGSRSAWSWRGSASLPRRLRPSSAHSRRESSARLHKIM